MTIRPRPHLREIAPVVHGSVSDVELASLGLRRSDVVDFSASTNPLGPSPAVIRALEGIAVDRYPVDGAGALRRELAARAELDPAGVIVGNGSSELLLLLAISYLAPGTIALVVGPTYGEYRRAALVAGAATREWRADPSTDFAVDWVAVVDEARGLGARVLFVGNPNNPTGTLAETTALDRLAACLPDTLVVIDEAYRAFVDQVPRTEPLLRRENVVLLRSLTKDYGLAGLRLGAAIAAPAVIRALDVVRPPWNVNAAAIAAGLAALEDVDHLARARDEVRLARALVTDRLRRLGLRVLPASANFLLVEVGDAAKTRDGLIRRGVVVRDCTSFGLSAYIRIGLRSIPECERLLAAFEDLPS